MPEISRFFGIVIAIYYRDHNPPHFHAKYGERQATFSIHDLTVLEGQLPPRIRGFVVEWAAQHQDELVRNWELAQAERPLLPIDPLE
jgi:hypothetical protein